MEHFQLTKTETWLLGKKNLKANMSYRTSYMVVRETSYSKLCPSHMLLLVVWNQFKLNWIFMIFRYLWLRPWHQMKISLLPFYLLIPFRKKKNLVTIFKSTKKKHTNKILMSLGDKCSLHCSFIPQCCLLPFGDLPGYRTKSTTKKKQLVWPNTFSCFFLSFTLTWLFAF